MTSGAGNVDHLIIISQYWKAEIFKTMGSASIDVSSELYSGLQMVFQLYHFPLHLLVGLLL